MLVLLYYALSGDRFKTIAPPSWPIRCETKTIQVMVTRILLLLFFFSCLAFSSGTKFSSHFHLFLLLFMSALNSYSILFCIGFYCHFKGATSRYFESFLA